MNLICLECHGSGNLRAPIGTRVCPECKGTGLRDITALPVVTPCAGRIHITAGMHEVSLQPSEVPAFVAAVIAAADACELAAS